jgi:hypothetical protein
MVDTQRALTGGVDTHADVHVAAVIDPDGGLLGVESFATNLAGYKLLWSSPTKPDNLYAAS